MASQLILCCENHTLLRCPIWDLIICAWNDETNLVVATFEQQRLNKIGK